MEATRTPPGYKGAINRLFDRLDDVQAGELQDLFLADDLSHGQVQYAIAKNFGVTIPTRIIGTWRRDHGVRLR